MVTDYESENEESQPLATIPSARFIFSPSNKGSPTDHTYYGFHVKSSSSMTVIHRRIIFHSVIQYCITELVIQNAGLGARQENTKMTERIFVKIKVY